MSLGRVISFSLIDDVVFDELVDRRGVVPADPLENCARLLAALGWVAKRLAGVVFEWIAEELEQTSAARVDELLDHVAQDCDRLRYRLGDSINRSCGNTVSEQLVAPFRRGARAEYFGED